MLWGVEKMFVLEKVCCNSTNFAMGQREKCAVLNMISE
jgi:hypothetical protein